MYVCIGSESHHFFTEAEIVGRLTEASVMAKIRQLIVGKYKGYANSRNCFNHCAFFIKANPHAKLQLALFSTPDSEKDRLIHACIIDSNSQVIDDVFLKYKPHLLGGRYYNDGNQLDGAKLVSLHHVSDVYKDAMKWLQSFHDDD